MADQVAEEIKVREWIARMKIILAGFLVLVVAGLTVYFVKKAQSAKDEKAFAVLFQAERTEEEAMKVAAAKNEAAKQKQPNFYEVAKTWNDDQKLAYIKQLDQVQVEYPESLPAALAGLRKGNFFFHTAKLSEAKAAFETVVKNFKSSGAEQSVIYKAMALDGLAAVLENEKNFAEARKAHQQSADLANNPLKAMALLGVARCYQAEGKAEEAKPLFEKVIKDFPNSEFEKRARALQAMPHSG